MNKTYLHSMTAFLCAVLATISTAGCEPPSHTHTWNNTYLHNAETHWLQCTGCEETKAIESHQFTSTSCEVCGYTYTPTEGVVYKLSNDGTHAMVVEYNGEETTVAISPTYEGAPVTEIMEYAFSSGYTLTKVILPSSIETIGKFAFEGCSGLTKILIPNNVKNIGENAFIKCTNLTELTVPFIGASLTQEENSHLGYWFNCDSESHQQYVPSSLKKVTITNASFLGDYAFRYCTNLSEVVIPRSVKTIGYGSFYACDSLTSIFIPDSVSLIKNYAFAYCYNITIYCEHESQPKDWDPRWNYDFPVVWKSKA